MQLVVLSFLKNSLFHMAPKSRNWNRGRFSPRTLPNNAYAFPSMVAIATSILAKWGLCCDVFVLSPFVLWCSSHQFLFALQLLLFTAFPLTTKSYLQNSLWSSANVYDGAHWGLAVTSEIIQFCKHRVIRTEKAFEFGALAADWLTKRGLEEGEEDRW